MEYQNNYPWLNDFCLTQPAATTNFHPEFNATLYLIGGKIFAMFAGDKHGKPLVSLKLDPMFGSSLRQQYKCIVPGYYMNKEHWNSLYLNGDTPDDIVKTMVQESYQLVLGSLSKKAQKELLGGSNNG